jgi:hypothetical protein
MMKSKAMKFYRTGAWILMLAGIGHTCLALPDTFLSGPFSPVSAEVLQSLKNTPINAVDFAQGGSTAFFPSAWGAYTGFAIGIGVLLAFMGLVLLLALKRDVVLDRRNRSLVLAAFSVSAVMLVISILFFFYWPTLLLTAALICFVMALAKSEKGVSYAAR